MPLLFSSSEAEGSIPITLARNVVGVIRPGDGGAGIPDEVAREAGLLAESVRLRGELSEALADPQRSDLDAQARELQDRIFQHRRTAPPFFDWLYELWRQGNQAHTQQVACDRVDEAVAALKSLAARPTTH